MCHFITLLRESEKHLAYGWRFGVSHVSIPSGLPAIMLNLFPTRDSYRIAQE